LAIFFGADKRIYYTHKNNIQIANKNYDAVSEKFPFAKEEKKEIRVDWFLSARFHIRKPRDVRHYSHEFLDRIFKHHHISAIIAFVLAFVLLIGWASVRIQGFFRFLQRQASRFSLH
jgi:hypothetical protein